MARIIITIEDLPNDRVKIISRPNYESLMAKDESGHQLTSADGYAIRMLNEARKISKEQGPTTKIWLPKVGR